MNKKSIKILSVLSLSVFFNIGCMEQPTKLNAEARQFPIHIANQLLIDAAAEGEMEVVQRALKLGADINYIGKHDGKIRQSTTTWFATSYGPAIWQVIIHGDYLDVAKFLIEKGAKIDDQFFKWAIENIRLEIAKYLMKNRLIKNPQYNYGHTGGDVNVIKFFIWYGVLHSSEDNESISNIVDKMKNKLAVAKLAVEERRVPENFDEETESIDEENIELNEEDIKELGDLITKAQEKMKLLEKYALKVEKFKNKSFKDIIQKVNYIIRNRVIIELSELIPVIPIQGIVAGYYLYPETPEEFFKIPEEQVDDLLRIYSELEEDSDKKAQEELPSHSNPGCVVL